MRRTFIEDAGVKHPIIGGPMYPCSNPELVAAVSKAGGLGIVQPLTLTYVEGYDFREGLRYIRTLTEQPIGMNVLIEKSAKRYQKKMEQWIDIALEEGVRFFITSLGKPDWVVEKAHPFGAKVYHDVTNLHWAEVAISSKVDGFIAVNSRAGGHTGTLDTLELLEVLSVYDLPIVCAGGIGDKQAFDRVLNIGYSAVQMGTRFIATKECKASEDYKQAIVDAQSRDIVLSENITGVPVSVINTAYIKKLGIKPGRFLGWMLSSSKLKHLVRLFYTLRALSGLKRGMKAKKGEDEFWQAGKSVAGIHKICSVEDVFKSLLEHSKKC